MPLSEGLTFFFSLTISPKFLVILLRNSSTSTSFLALAGGESVIPHSPSILLSCGLVNLAGSKSGIKYSGNSLARLALLAATRLTLVLLRTMALDWREETKSV